LIFVADRLELLDGMERIEIPVWCFHPL